MIEIHGEDTMTIDVNKLSLKELKYLIQMKLTGVSIKIANIKRDNLCLWSDQKLQTKPVLTFKQFILLKVTNETYKMFVNDINDIANIA